MSACNIAAYIMYAPYGHSPVVIFLFYLSINGILVERALFPYCCPDCLRCLVNSIQMA